MSLVEILHQFDPSDRISMSTAQVEEIAEAHLLEVLSQLPTTKHLPKSTELSAFLEGDPITVEKPITAGDILAHLEGAVKTTPEIGVDVFSDGTNVMRVGTADGVLSDLGWTPFAKRAVLDFHTHPDPTAALWMRQPSIRDLDLALDCNKAVLIGSSDGITFVPKLSEELGHNLWRQYVTETRGFDEAAYNEYGANRAYQEFISDVVQTVFVPWSNIEPSKTLTEIADILTAQ
jgi:hypothetical protein